MHMHIRIHTHTITHTITQTITHTITQTITHTITHTHTHTSGQYHVELGYCDPQVQGEEVIMIKGSPWKTSFEDPWTKIKVKETDKQPPPQAIGGVGAVSIMKKVVLFGGLSDGVVCFDPENNAWERPVFDPEEAGQGVMPSQRVGMTMTALDNEKAVIIGGHAPVVKDEDGVEAKPSEFYNDVHVLICEKGVWKWHNANDPALPGDKFKERGKHAACLIPVGKKVIVFGGMSSEFVEGGDLLDSVSGTSIHTHTLSLSRTHTHAATFSPYNPVSTGFWLTKSADILVLRYLYSTSVQTRRGKRVPRRPMYCISVFVLSLLDSVP